MAATVWFMVAWMRPVSGLIILRTSQLCQGRKHIDGTDRRVDRLPFRNSRPRPDKWNVGRAFPERMFTPVKFFTVMISVITPQNQNGIVRIGSRLDGIHHTTQHRIGIGDTGAISVNSILNRIQ